MASYIYIVVAVVALWLVKSYLSLRNNIAKAKASGFPYVILPSTGIGIFYEATHDLWLNFFQRNRWTKHWFWPKVLDPHRSWLFGHEIRDRMGENYIIASPGGTYLNLTQPEAVAQMALRRHEFQKPIEVYSIVDMFGPSVVTTEGETWKRHRKIVGPAFSEKSNALVWKESLRQASGMLDLWASQGNNTTDDIAVKDIAQDTATLALHVISGVGFGVKQIWDGQDESQLGDDRIEGFNTVQLKSNHKMTFKKALHVLLQNVIWMVVLPTWILRNSPFKIHKTVYQAFRECGEYFKELSEHKSKQLAHGEEAEKGSMDLMKPLVQASEVPKAESNGLWLTKQEVIADSWIMLFAGHETSANTIHFSLLFLATALRSQRLTQVEIDGFVGDRTPDEWTYDVDMGRLYRGMVGATLNEALRLMPPVIDIPKIVREKPQPLNFGGKTYMVPERTFIHFSGVSSHRNPRYWPHSPSKISNKPHDMDDFVPERWMLKGKGESSGRQSAETAKQKAPNDGIENVSFETGEGLFTPQKGVFVPFSEGPRACPGRRFAQVEITAVLSRILRSHSVELDVREWASDEELKKMTVEEKTRIYEIACSKARKLIGESFPVITLKMVGKYVPVRFVKRGAERFADCYL